MDFIPKADRPALNRAPGILRALIWRAEAANLAEGTDRLNHAQKAADPFR